MSGHVALAFISGVVAEALYALGVLFLGERRDNLASVMSFVWGASILLGVSESFKTWTAGLAWCVGLAVGTKLGTLIKDRAAPLPPGTVKP